ncbi:MAG TPA: sortase [Candidatus Saccharimonadales bacterium]|nr:sortase [Candidatus Saccharimonadales bacterium]
MTTVYYKKNKGRRKLLLRFAGLGIFSLGLLIILYVFFPLISWKLYYASAFASQDIYAPIPKVSMVNPAAIGGLLTAASQAVGGVDFTNAQNWYPSSSFDAKGKPKVSSYILSIPKINIARAVVSTTDSDLAAHLVHFTAGALPPDNGNAIVFGHSTLPQLYDVHNYKTIFTNLYKLNVGDALYVTVSGITYTYKIQNIIVVEPEDTSVLSQDLDTSYLTLITCTPPGTIWKRLVVKARLEKIS